jgi:hypothetical protein
MIKLVKTHTSQSYNKKGEDFAGDIATIVEINKFNVQTFKIQNEKLSKGKDH